MESNMNIKSYIEEQLDRKQEGIELCASIIEEMTKELHKGKDFYNDVKDMASDSDRKVLKYRYFVNMELVEEINVYRRNKFDYEDETVILERLLAKL